MHSAFQHILKEIRIRVIWLIICLLVTCACCSLFAEELLFTLTKPFLVVSTPNLAFLSTQLTETLNTYVTTSIILSACACTPYFLYQIWCFYVPSCNQTQRAQLNRLCFISAFAFFFFLLVTFLWILPSIWYILYSYNNTTTYLFRIQLQPKIYDFIILTMRFLLLSSLCSQIPIIIISCIEYNVISLQECTQYRRYFGFCAVLISALITPPDLWSQLTALILIYFVIECTVLYAYLRVHYNAKKDMLNRRSHPRNSPFFK